MRFEEILTHSITNLPIIQESNISFRTVLKNKFKELEEIINCSENLSREKDFNQSFFRTSNQILREGILKTIDLYLEGKICAAFQCLSDFMKKSNASNYLPRPIVINEEANFYRIRKGPGNCKFLKEELFHIPFEKRGRVKTQRYSIPGLPSLYLANSIYVAWEEMNRPPLDGVHAVRMSNTKSLKILDLTFDEYNGKKFSSTQNTNRWHSLYKVMIWPLVAACSVKVRDSEDSFKPEYIIPQLLLQWVVEEKEIDGIMYSSTNIKTLNSGSKGFFYNFVFPTKTFGNDSGYCQQLIATFQSTAVLPIALRQIILPHGRFVGQESIHVDINPDIFEIEIVDTIVNEYSSTDFGIIEHNLSYMPLQPILK